jgi:hypothetical protein
MTTGTPAPAGLALASYERPVGVNPPLGYPAYRSTALRAPRRPLQPMPQGLTEVTGPLPGRERVIAAMFYQMTALLTPSQTVGPGSTSTCRPAGDRLVRCMKATRRRGASTCR